MKKDPELLNTLVPNSVKQQREKSKRTKGSFTPSTIFALVLAFISLSTITNTMVKAGSLTPPETVTSTMHSLQEIWETIAGSPNTEATVASSTGGVIERLTYIQEFVEDAAIPKNIFNGTGQGIDGGTEADGGVDDYNNGSTSPTDRYATSWTKCNSGNSYCGTGLSSADARDDTTGLIFSYPCNGSGCSTFSSSSPLAYSWDNSSTNNSGKTAQELCSSGVHGESGWYLPHQKQLMLAYINGAYGNLEPLGTIATTGQLLGTLSILPALGMST